MPKVTARQVLISALMAALFAPVYLSSGSAAFRPAWFTARVAILPASVWMVLILIAVFVLMVWVVSGGVYGRDDDDREAGR
ncbi:MAG TPA: hypothetical protein VL460_10390 [Caulobacteraceae bacterium]|jgi:hypothetical protein|nr:hypothetical protein [Caulobacteraceae bacterium]